MPDGTIAAGSDGDRRGVTGILEADRPERLAIARRLFEEYASSIGVDLGFQNFAEELAGLPGDYARPRGGLMLGYLDATPVGCVAFRPLAPGVAEMKRLYVRPSARGSGWGRRLVARVAADAREAGYERVRLDTLPSMGAAVGLYLAMGFREIASYRHNPVPGARFLELDLGQHPLPSSTGT
jgi:ribosomal protein S18 acetylase RimI-like enzyme